MLRQLKQVSGHSVSLEDHGTSYLGNPNELKAYRVIIPILTLVENTAIGKDFHHTYLSNGYTFILDQKTKVRKYIKINARIPCILYFNIKSVRYLH
jgi:hypothetical protein